eukprot:scaffold8128_cov60-Cylindrotheca_fusiformis.AAC.3
MTDREAGTRSLLLLLPPTCLGSPLLHHTATKILKPSIRHDSEPHISLLVAYQADEDKGSTSLPEARRDKAIISVGESELRI